MQEKSDVGTSTARTNTGHLGIACLKSWSQFMQTHPTLQARPSLKCLLWSHQLVARRPAGLLSMVMNGKAGMDVFFLIPYPSSLFCLVFLEALPQ